MRTLRFISYLFYRYYSTGSTKNIAYTKTMCAVCMLFCMHIIEFLLLIDKTALITHFDQSHRIEIYLKFFLLISPLLLIFNFLIKEIQLQTMYYDENKIKKGNKYLIAYVSIDIIFLFTLIWIKKA